MIKWHWSALKGSLIGVAAFALIGGAALAQSSDPERDDPLARFSAEPVSQTPIQAADMIISGGPIYTADSDNAVAEAVAIKDGRFIFVGSQSGANAFEGDETVVISLDGAAAYPGFVDSHSHLSGIGARELTLNLEGLRTLDSFLKAIKNWRETHPEDTILIGGGWIETFWAENRFPTRFDLDGIVSDIPVLLMRADNHALVANSKALEMAGIDGNTEPPFGGEVLKNALGEATGILVDNAMKLVDQLRPERDLEHIKLELVTGAEVYARYGWTGTHNMSVPFQEVLALEELARERRLPIHVYNSVTQGDADQLFESGARSVANARVVTRAIKMYMDGALGSRGAALLKPYSDAETNGLLLIQKERALPIMQRALRDGIQINTHAIGDRANRLLLDWYQEAFQGLAPISRPFRDPKWRVEHAQLIALDDLNRFAEMGVIPSMQPSHAISDLHFAPDRVGDDRLDGAYAWNSLIQSGVIIAAGSDAPVERGDPLIEFYAAVARRDLKGYQGQNWRGGEAVSRQDALKMFTHWAAEASFMEAERGTIEVGKRADLTAFSGDIMTIPADEIPDAEAILTLVDGEIMYVLQKDTPETQSSAVPEEEPFADEALEQEASR